MVSKDYIEGEYRIIEYENGAIVKQLVSQGNTTEEQIIIPPSPLELLKQENAELKAQQALMQQALDDLLLASTGGAL